MTRNILYYLSLLFIFFACADSADTISVETGESANKIGVKPEPFTLFTVQTKGDMLTSEEQKVTSLHLFIFSESGEYLASMDGSHDQSYQYLTQGSFHIDRARFVDQEAAKHAHVCIVANVDESTISPENITSYADLQAFLFEIDPIVTIPQKGLLLYGDEICNLSMASSQGENYSISLKSMYARIDFELSLVPEKMMHGLPLFSLSHYDLHNLPSKMNLDLTQEETFSKDKPLFDKEGIAVEGDNTLQAGEELTFTFYMLEHKVNALRSTPSGGYPDGLPEEEKQRFKPELAKDEAAYVVLNGHYMDVHGRTYEVKHTIYLGANHENDFQIKRGTQYKNRIRLKGITSHDDADRETISFDSRVEVVNRDYIVSIERELLLDSHYEVRPVDFHLAKPGSKVTVEIVDPHKTGKWFRMEHKKEKQRYFTDDLVTKELKNNIKTTINTGANNRIYLYFDETPYYSHSGYRTGILRVKYYARASQSVPTSTTDYKFIQHDLFPVEYQGREYLIEYFEEYLYNFDPEDEWGSTQQGMPWGLNGEQLSDTKRSIDLGSGLIASLVEAILYKINPYYDYKEPRKGQEYTNKIIEKSDTEKLELNQKPRHAAEYCYNKNKRDDDGDVVDKNWYLPAIGEIEDICSGAYTDFAVFQNEYYWGSQPAYDRNKLTADGWITYYVREYMTDNTEYARATKVVYENQKPTTVLSQPTEGYELHYKVKYNPLGWLYDEQKIYLQNQKFSPGYQRRNELNRVRAVRRKTKELIDRRKEVS